MSEATNHTQGARDYWNPYAAGVALGLVLLASYIFLGYGLGASGAASRFSAAAVEAVAPAHAQETYFANYLQEGMSPLNNWIVFGVLGVFLGGLVGSVTAGRHARGITSGPRISPSWRLVLALSGGIVMGFAARIARGCTSGQALSGGALLSAGSWIFMMAVFAGGYALAWFTRRQWT